MLLKTMKTAAGCARGRCGWPAFGMAAAALSAFAASAAFAQSPPGAVTQAALQAPAAPGTVAAASPSAMPESEIRSRLDSTGGLTAGGEKLHIGLLRQFYAAHNYEPVWPTHVKQAEALLADVMRAWSHGLDPELFHAAVLRKPAALPPIDRDLLLSDAFLAYADALARGAMPIEVRMDDEDLKPEPVDVPAMLDKAIASPDPAAVIEALAPSTSTYQALRRALQAYRAGGEEAAAAPAGNHPAARPTEAHLRQLVANLERQRWLPRKLPAERVWVDIVPEQLTLYKDDRPVFTTKIVVGEADKQSPEVETTISGVQFNPPWNVPRSIITEEIMPKLSRDPDYLSRHHMVMRHNGLIQQLPGPHAALGQIKFEMPNRFDVYLHDTPQKYLFARDNRRQSHGCIRVQNPRELAALLLDQPAEAVAKAIGLGYTNSRPLPAPVPVFIVYQTAVAQPDGAIAFRPDPYERDIEIWQHLHPREQAPVAEHEQPGQRRG